MLRPLVCLLGCLVCLAAGPADAAHGHGPGSFGGHGTHGDSHGKPRAPVYVVLQASEANESTAFQSALKDATSNLAPFAGHLLAETSSVTAVAGSSRKTVALLAFDTQVDIQMWQQSGPVKALTDDKAANVVIYSVAGLPDAAIAFQVQKSGPDAAFNTKPPEPSSGGSSPSDSIKDICRGC